MVSPRAKRRIKSVAVTSVVALFAAIVLKLMYGEQIVNFFLQSVEVPTQALFGGSAIVITVGAIILIGALLLLLIPQKVEEGAKFGDGTIIRRRPRFSGGSLTLVVGIIVFAVYVIGGGIVYAMIKDIFGDFTPFVLAFAGLLFLVKLIRR